MTKKRLATWIQYISLCSRSAFIILIALIVFANGYANALTDTERAGLFQPFYEEPGQCAASASTTTTSGDVFIVGDSLSVGLSTTGKIQEKFKAKDINATVNGLSSRPLYGPSFVGGDGLSIIGSDPVLKTAGTVIVELGTNDPTNIAGYLPEAIDKIRSLNAQAKIYWVNLAPDSRYNAANQVIDQQATPKNYKVIKWSNSADSYLPPGDVHPNASGYEAMADLIVSSVTAAGTVSAPGGSCCSSGATLLPGNDNIERIWNFFITKGFQPHMAAGIMGNMKAESGLNPRRVQSTSTPSGDSDTPTNGVGFGLIQWTYKERQQPLIDLAASRSLPAGDLGVQLDYIMTELEGSYYKSRAYDPLLASTDVAQATYIILENYEIPADIPGQKPGRLGFAQEFLTQYGSGTNGVAPPVSAGGGGCGAVTLDASGCPNAPVEEDQIVDAAGIKVHSCIAAEVKRIIELANTQGVGLAGSGWRSNKRQIELRRSHCGTSDYAIYEMRSSDCSPPTAIPGRSLHERGTAVDFTCGGGRVPRNSPCFTFLLNNTSLINLDSEPWHWSISGG